MNSYIESLFELIYPEKNICCICDIYDEAIGEKYICKDCEMKIKKITPPYCIKCSKPINHASDVDLCVECFNHEKYFEASRSPYSCDGIIKKCIGDFKYYNKPYLLRFLGSSLLRYMQSINYVNFDYILSVPLHSSKMKKRGYNQSELLARYIACKLNIEYFDALKRIKKTEKQSSNSKLNRSINIINAFSIKNNRKYNAIKNSSILLVDDIYTTGSTVNECTKVLLNYGVKNVYVITVAR